MTTYLLDTDSFIFLLKKQPRIEAKVAAIGYGIIAVSAVTVAEVLYGAYYSANPVKSLAMSRALLGQMSVVDLDKPIAESFGRQKAELRRQGQLLEDFDLRIAASAVAAGRTLVTNNTKHFQRLIPFGLVLENWVS